jgi:hypothetical protein
MFVNHLYMCADMWHCYIQKFEQPEDGLHETTLVYVHDRMATFLMEQLITVGGKLHDDETV